MSFEQFIEVNFRADTLKVIEQANRIIAEYLRQGFKLTLRQLYYQFVSRDLLRNKQSEYKRLGSIIDNGRQAGLIDWSAIEDRTRNLETVNMWSSPAQILRAVAEQYKENPWLKQPIYPEVWIEKDALTGVIEPVCEEFRVPYFACRGYASQSEMYDAAKRLQDIARRGRQPVIFHLGDHDPSGLDMTRDNEDRLSMFARQGIRIVRLALNMDQIEQYDPPPNPAKDTDSRFTDYQAEHGDSSWELDALEPTVIDQLIRDALEEEIDPDEWSASMATEESNRLTLQATADNWNNVKRYLKYRDYDMVGEEINDLGTTVEDILTELEDRD